MFGACAEILGEFRYIRCRNSWRISLRLGPRLCFQVVGAFDAIWRVWQYLNPHLTDLRIAIRAEPKRAIIDPFQRFLDEVQSHRFIVNQPQRVVLIEGIAARVGNVAGNRRIGGPQALIAHGRILEAGNISTDTRPQIEKNILELFELGLR